MDEEVCGEERAEHLWDEIAAASRQRLPADLAIFRRAVLPVIAAAPLCRARAVAAFARGLHGLPSRAEIARICSGF